VGNLITVLLQISSRLRHWKNFENRPVFDEVMPKYYWFVFFRTRCIRPTYLRAGALTYLFTYLHSCLGEYKTGNISDTVEDRAKVTINGLDKVVHGLSIAAKVYDLE